MPRWKTLRAAAPLLLIALLAPALTSSAHAAKITTKKAMWGPAFVGDKSQFPTYASLGVGIYQHLLEWDQVAPTKPANALDPSDPAYHWPADLDAAQSEAAKYGIEISLQVLYTPQWANGGMPHQFAPTDPQDYANFVVAASKRYPNVHLWMVWGEPTRTDRFQPMGAHSRRGPELYARILDATYAALKARSQKNKIIGGNTFTVGIPGPIPFIRRLRLPNGQPPRMDYYGQNPFSARMPDLHAPPLGGGNADFDDLDQLAKVIDRNLARPGQEHLKFFLSEYCAPTDHPNNEFNFFVDRKTQARWMSAALRISRSYKRIFTLGTFLYDDGPDGKGTEVNRGLLTDDGQKKPSYRAFRDG